MLKMLSSAMERAKKGKRVSINIYIKDLSSQSISSTIDILTKDLNSTERNNIIFEILEEKYGIINDTFIQNIRILQDA
jgi:EAL domain-containing protein (putative c-di-GMP-specific phosphodiesterase class I)